MRFANRVLFSMMWEIIVGPSLPNHKNLFCKVTLAWLISEWGQEIRGCLVEETRHSLSGSVRIPKLVECQNAHHVGSYFVSSDTIKHNRV